MKNTGKRLLALLLVAIMIAAIGCATPAETEPASSATDAPADAAVSGDESTTEAATDETAAAAKTDETLTVLLSAEPTSMCALNGIAQETELEILEAVGGTLYEYDGASDTCTPSLATGYEQIDETHYRFTLREDAVFADGTPVTAQDVIYTYTQLNAAGIANAGYFNIAECVAEDEHTVVLALTRYVPGWLSLVSESGMSIYSEAGVTAAGGLEATDRTPPVSCGRYNLSEWKSGEYVLLERNENYWDDSYSGYYKYIKFTFVSDSASRVMAVQSGDADVTTKIPMAQYVSVQNDTSVESTLRSSSAYTVLFNCSKGICADVKLREALCYAIDPSAANAVVNMGQGTLEQGIWPSTHPMYKDVYGGGYLPYDLEKAKTLLADAGYAEGTEVNIVVLQANVTMATVVQESLRLAGINANVQACEQSVYLPAARGGEFDILICTPGAASGIGPNSFNQVDPRQAGASVNNCYIVDPELEEMIDRANSSDPETEKAGWSDVFDYIFNNFCVRGLCSSSVATVHKPGLTGFTQAQRTGYQDYSFIRPAA